MNIWQFYLSLLTSRQVQCNQASKVKKPWLKRNMQFVNSKTNCYEKQNRLSMSIGLCIEIGKLTLKLQTQNRLRQVRSPATSPHLLTGMQHCRWHCSAALSSRSVFDEFPGIAFEVVHTRRMLYVTSSTYQ